MTYRTAIEGALAEWDKGFLGVSGLFRSRSPASARGASLLRFVMRNDPLYDNDLERAVDWLVGNTDVEYRLDLIGATQQLAHSSKLYQCLTTALASAPAPRRRPVVAPAPSSSSARASRHPPRSGSSSHRAPATATVPTSRTPTVLSVPSPPSVSGSTRAVPLGEASSSIRPSPSRSRTTTVATTPAPSVARASGLSSFGVTPRSEAHQALALGRWESEWRGIEITDLPTGEFGQYKFTERDPITTQQKGSAAAAVALVLRRSGVTKATELPEYWIRLGQMIMGSKVGRCFSCAAAAVYSIVMTSECDDLVIAVAGAPKYDHHFVLLGTMDAIAESNENAMYVVDLWAVQSGGGTKFVVPWGSYTYKSRGVQIFCVLDTRERSTHYAYARELGPPKKPLF